MYGKDPFAVLLPIWLSSCLIPLISGFLVREKECPDFVDPTIFYYGSKYPTGLRHRALSTTPRQFQVRPSKIPGAGLGVFATRFIRRHTWLGEYEGEFTPLNFTNPSRGSYSWMVHTDGIPSYYVDGLDLRLSNWLRWVNCARHVSEENVDHSLCYGRVYYRTTRDVWPGSELLTFYGVGYARALGIDVDGYYRTPQQERWSSWNGQG